MIFLQKFTFVFRHRAGQQNKAVDALNRRHNLLIILRAKLISFEYLPTTYAHYEDFGEIWAKCSSHHNMGEYHIQEG